MITYQGIRQTNFLTLEDFTAPGSDVRGKVAAEAWKDNISNSAFRMSQLENSRYDSVTPEKFDIASDIDPDDLNEDYRRERPAVSSEKAQEMIGKLPIEIPKRGFKEQELQIIIQRKIAEIKARDVIARGEGGIGQVTASFFTALGVSMLDPANVAAVFVPIVGPARYASMLSKAATSAARAGVRARVGAVEGAVGTALLEPVVLAAASSEQRDYDLMDSFLNVTMGTVLGGGLHVGLGALKDGLSRTAARDSLTAIQKALEDAGPAHREALGRVSVAQMLSDRPPHLEHLAGSNQVYKTVIHGEKPSIIIDGVEVVTTKTGQIDKKAVLINRLESRKQAIESQMDKQLPRAERRSMEKQVRVLEAQLKKAKDHKSFLSQAADELGTDTKKPLPRIRKRAKELSLREQNRILAEISEIKKKLDVETKNLGLKSELNRIARAMKQIRDDAGVELKGIDIPFKGDRSKPFNLDDLKVETPSKERAFDFEKSKTKSEMAAAARQQLDPSSDVMIVPETLAYKKTVLDKAPKTDDADGAQQLLDEVMELVDTLESERGVSDPAFRANLEVLDDTIAHTKEQGTALRVAAACAGRK